MDKKKKIIIGIAIVLAIALVVGLFFLLNKEKEPEEQEITVRYLMEKNEEYFKALDSVDVTVHYLHEWTVTTNNNITEGLWDLTCNSKKVLKTGETEARLIFTHIDGEYKNNVTHNLFIENQNGNLVSYVQEIVNNSADSGWFLNVEHPQLYNIASATDFDYIGKYWLGLDIFDEIVEVDGIRCYKVEGSINNFEKIAKHYGIYEQIGFFSDPLYSYADVEIYFREDNYRIHSFIYDFTDYWMETRANINGGNAKQGTMILEVKYNAFNTVSDIVVDEYIKESAIEELKDPLYFPVEFNENLYDIVIGDISLKICDNVSKYEGILDMTPQVYTRENGECNGYVDGGVTYINPDYLVSVDAKLPSGQKCSIVVQNISDVAVPLNECIIIGFSTAETDDIFALFKSANEKVHSKTTIKELRDILGPYNIRYDNGATSNIIWRSYIDWSELTIVINNETGNMISFSVLCFNVESKLNGETLQDVTDKLMAEQNKEQGS